MEDMLFETAEREVSDVTAPPDAVTPAEGLRAERFETGESFQWGVRFDYIKVYLKNISEKALKCTDVEFCYLDAEGRVLKKDTFRVQKVTDWDVPPGKEIYVGAQSDRGKPYPADFKQIVVTRYGVF